MDLFDRLLEIPITVVLIIGGYQFYFWCQRQSFYEARYLPMRLDARIAFDPRWVWVYSGLYYPMIVLAALAQPSWPDYARTVGGFLFCWPSRWRSSCAFRWRSRWTGARANVMAARTRHPALDAVHGRGLALRQAAQCDAVDARLGRHDGGPDALGAAGRGLRWIGWLFPALIGISAIKTKQHYLLDIPAGAAMGAAAFFAWTHVWPS
jgi:hypothetical protein